MKNKGQTVAGMVAFFLMPWAIYGWVALTGTTCAISRFARKEEPRVATGEDLSTAFEAALFISGVVVVTSLLIGLRRRRGLRRDNG